MTIVFDPGWLNWDTDVKEITKLEKKETEGTLTKGNANKLAGLRELRKKRSEDAVFLLAFNELNIQAAIFQATARHKSSADANQLLNDCRDATQKVTIAQGTHQPEDVTTGGYMLHFDAKSPRDGGKCFHLYVGQLSSGPVVITSIEFMPRGSKSAVTAQPDTPLAL